MAAKKKSAKRKKPRGGKRKAVPRYEGSDKHKDPWQPGRKGSLCPREIDEQAAARMLMDSEVSGKKRFATDGVRAFCGSEHRAGRWHGWPVGWKEVPPSIRIAWVKADRVKRRDVNRYWDGGEARS